METKYWKRKKFPIRSARDHAIYRRGYRAGIIRARKYLALLDAKLHPTAK